MVAHLKDGWTLEDYTWDPKTGVGMYTYERKRIDTGAMETQHISKAQPYHPSHTSWHIALAAGRL